MPTNDHYDVVIIGSGAGGGTLAWKLAPSGKRILLLERGGYLPRERDNWDRKNDEFTPEQNYYVGGNTKFYGAALFRLRPEDFGEITHHGGISPAWPISYQDYEPWYADAERLYYVHGAAGEDPTDGPRSGDFPYPAVQHEPRIQQLHDDLVKLGLHPSHLPVGVLLDQDARESGFAGRLCRSRAWRAPEPRARHRCEGRPARDRHLRPAGQRGRRHDGRRLRGAVLGGRRRGVVRRSQLGAAPVAVGERPAFEGARQRLRPGGSQLHAPQQPGADGYLA